MNKEIYGDKEDLKVEMNEENSARGVARRRTYDDQEYPLSLVATSSEASEDVCWICLDSAEKSRPLLSPCGCPRKVHEICLARWQLQKAGKDEEQCCRFCKQSLPDWRPSLTPEALKKDLVAAQPTMMVTFRKQVCYVTVKPGPDGLQEFTNVIKEKFGLNGNAAINVTFGCREPMSGNYLKLDGHGAFNAAVHCATVSAAAREKQKKGEPTVETATYCQDQI